MFTSFFRKRRRKRLYQACLLREYRAIQSYITLRLEETLEDSAPFRLDHRIVTHYGCVEDFLIDFDELLECVVDKRYINTVRKIDRQSSQRRLDDYLVDRDGYTVSLRVVLVTLNDAYRLFSYHLDDIGEDKKNYYIRHHTKLLEETLNILVLLEEAL